MNKQFSIFKLYVKLLFRNGSQTEIPRRKAAKKGWFYQLAGRQQSSWTQGDEKVFHSKKRGLYKVNKQILVFIAFLMFHSRLPYLL